MARLSRVELQEANRARVLEAARQEFAERGFRDAKIDAIAERAGLTRGAVYSNFPGKRALYFAVLAAIPTPVVATPSPGSSSREALGAFARAWTARLPMTEDDRLGLDVMQEIVADERIRRPYAQLTRVSALLLGLALERLEGYDHQARTAEPARQTPDRQAREVGSERRVRVAEAVLTQLHGADQLSASAPGFVEPFDVVRVCEHLASVDLSDSWPDPPWAPFVPLAEPVSLPWTPAPAYDLVRGKPAQLSADGVVAVLGLHRLEAIEEAVRGLPPGASVTALLVTGDPGELVPLAHLALGEVLGCLRQAFPLSAWPRVQLVIDSTGALAASAGVSAVSDGTEAAVRIAGGRIVARAEGRGACYSTAEFSPAP